MNLFYFFKMMGDLSMIFAFENSAMLVFGCNISSFLPLLVLSLSGTLGYYLNQKSPKLRYLAIPAMLPALYHPENFVSLLGVLVACLYVGLHIVLQHFELSHYERVSFFQLGCKVLPLLLIPRMILVTSDTPAPAFFPYLLIFAVSTLLLTQTLRHGPEILSQRRFRIMCFGALSCVLLITALFSSPWFLSLVGAVLKTIYLHLFAPIILLLSYAVGLVFCGIIALLSKLGFNLQEANQMAEIFFSGLQADLKHSEIPDAPQNSSFLTALGTVIAILILAFLIYFFVSRLKRRKGDQHDSSIRETRSAIDQARSFAEEGSRDLIEPRDSRSAVRYHYRKFLRCCKRVGISLSPEMNSSIVEKKAREAFQPESAGWIQNIRSIYIRARYSNHEVSKESVQQIKADVQKIQNETSHFLKRL